MSNQTYTPLKDNIEWALLILSAILLGIWAVKGTIALRNILLVLGTLLTIYYIILEIKYGNLNENLSIRKFLPLILMGCTFIWVILHYFIFSVNPSEQIDELTSTWLRALFASIVGLGTGLALRNHPNRLSLLWLGILIAFFVLYYQYIPRALAKNKLLVPDYDHYIFNLKINTVLMGMILFTGINSAIWDQLRTIEFRRRYLNPWYFLYWFFGTSLVLWAFVYIVDARNGIGLSVILSGFWFLCALIFFIYSQRYQQNPKNFLTLSFISFSFCLVLVFSNLQMSLNKGWSNLFEDAKIAVQIDRYTNWQDLNKMGYPKRENGEFVTQNTYERIAWATAGARLIISYPQGVGVLSYPFTKILTLSQKMETNQNLPRIATHSGWIELGLAFGIPILIFIFLALLLISIDTIRHKYPLKMTVLSFVVLVLFLYAVGETAIQHGLEILYFLLFLKPALLFDKSKTSCKCIIDHQLNKYINK